jgi:DNA polymerase sigma
MIRAEVGDVARPRIIHISVEDRNQTGKAAVKWIIDHLSARRYLRPLFLVMKGLTVHYRLHEHKSGGIRSYTLFILLLSRILEWNDYCDLGKLLLDILYYYGFYYNVYEPRPEEKEVCIAMHIQDPLNPSKDLGMRCLI